MNETQFRAWLDNDGRCKEFREWWYRQETPE